MSTTGLQLAGMTEEQLMANAPEASSTLAPAETQEQQPATEAKRRGRPPGTGKNQKAAVSSGDSPKPQQTAQSPAAATEPAKVQLTEEERKDAAMIRAILPHELIAGYMRWIEGYKGNAFDLSDAEVERLAKKYLNVQRAISILPPGNKRRLLTLAFGDGDSESALVLAGLAISAQLEIAGVHYDTARDEMAASKK